MENVKLSIAGMRCGGCVARVTAALKETPGVTVENVSVGTAVVTLDPARTSADTVVSALKAAGYDAKAEAAHEYR